MRLFVTQRQIRNLVKFFLQNGRSAIFYAAEGVIISKEDDATDFLQYLTEQGANVNFRLKVKFLRDMSLFAGLHCV